MFVPAARARHNERRSDGGQDDDEAGLKRVRKTTPRRKLPPVSFFFFYRDTFMRRGKDKTAQKSIRNSEVKGEAALRLLMIDRSKFHNRFLAQASTHTKCTALECRSEWYCTCTHTTHMHEQGIGGKEDIASVKRTI